MGTYNSAVITNGGQSMIAQAVAGASLEFTTIKTSSYAYPAGTNLATLTTINGINQSKDITSATVYNSRVIKISAAVDNTGISTAYTINTIGIYAKVGSSAESLFAVVTASSADTMPAYDNRPYSYIYDVNLTMQNAANVTVTVNAAGLVNVADLDAAKVEIQGEIDDLKSALGALYPVKAALISSLNKNRFDGRSAPGYLDANGKLIQGTDWYTTDLIYVEDLTSVVATMKRVSSGNRETVALNLLCTYDHNGSFIAQVGQDSTHPDVYTVGSGVAYIRFSYHSTNFSDLQVESGTVRTDYTRYNYKILDETLSDMGENITSRINRELDTGVLDDITSEFTLTNGYIDKDSGNYYAYSASESTDFLSIYEYADLYISGSPLFSSCLYAIYDSGKRLLGTYGNGSAITDYHFLSDNIFVEYPTAFYVRFCSITTSGGSRLAIKRNKKLIDIIGTIEGSWTGKKWVCVGDSLTEVNSRTTKHYFDYISEKTGISVVNMGLSGSGYKHTTESGTGAFYQRISNVPTDADVVTIFGSGNDLSHGYTLGAVTDTGTETICGCINTTLDTLIGLIPTVQLGIVAPTPWVSFPPSVANNAMAQYVDALKTICANRSIPFLDLYHCSNLRPWTAEGRAACYSKDEGNGVHPDEEGHKLIAPRFKGFLGTLLM